MREKLKQFESMTWSDILIRVKSTGITSSAKVICAVRLALGYERLARTTLMRL